jgi:outer membrane protein assembly factor BamD
MRRALAVPFSLLAVFALACATDGQVPEGSYAADAKQNYDAGVEALDDGNPTEAIRLFDHVRTKYPYSSYAPLAELRAADAEFRRERYVEAIDGYQRFLKFHPAHPEVDWAAFRIGESHYEAIPSGFFLLPPPAEKDQTEVLAAKKSLEDFLAGYPNSKYVPKARELLSGADGILAAHEVAVSKFYAKRDQDRGAAGRLEYLLVHYPTAKQVGEAAHELVRLYRKLGEPARAKEILEAFLARNPGAPQAAEVKAALGELG